MKYIKEFFFLNLKEYENIAVPVPIGMVSIALTVVMCLAAFYYYYYKNYTCELLRALKRHEATSEESAKTLAELRLGDRKSIKRALMRQTSLSKMVKEVGRVELTYEEYVEKSKKRGYRGEKIDFSTAKFYLSPEEKDIAATQIEKCPTLLMPILTSVIALITLCLLFLFLEPLLVVINNWAGK